MRTIPLKNGGEAIVSAADFEWLSKFQWNAWTTKQGYTYAARNEGTKRIRMHREICGNPDGLVIDHINGNTLDNRRDNLRAVTHTENLHNVTKPTRAVSGERNIYRCRSGYVVKVMRFGTRHYGGHHKELEAAIAARDGLKNLLAGVAA